MVTITDRSGIVIILGAIIGVIGSVLIFILCIFMINKPMKKIGRFAEKIKVGNLGISEESESTIEIHTSDEIGILARSLEQAYNQLKLYITEIQERMNGLAQGDFITQSTIDFKGDFIFIKNSINDIVMNLNQTMSSINIASAQVASGSKQIADGAQALAQGSTEQAASVEELSASINDIAMQMQENKDKAVHAAGLAGTIRDNAEKGSKKMEEMTTAVIEIDQASQSINRVIKVIDDIAFQTNILALNAAVEAARAGQHGKGFAVVAEEVRNLAAKSADAAKDTGALIENSIEKAEVGSRIAKDTAESLNEIVSGIIESTQIFREIAASSERQYNEIMEINTGIDQVTQVVQTNSATSEENAAASEEMSGQANLLEQLVAEFKLRDVEQVRSSNMKSARGGDNLWQ